MIPSPQENIQNRNAELYKAVATVQAFEQRTSIYSSVVATISYGLYILVKRYDLLPEMFTPLPIFLYFFFGIIALGTLRKGESEAIAKIDKVLIPQGMITSSLLAHMIVHYLPGLAGLLVVISFQSVPLWCTILLWLISIGAPQAYYVYRKNKLRNFTLNLK
ncbi:MAG: hypothetical protein WCV50_01230 [Patescibacteria group bacterium]|jgi:uncharacterized membrane protein